MENKKISNSTSLNHFRLVPYPLNNRAGPEVIEELSKRLLAMQAAPAGTFLVDGDIFETSKQLIDAH